MRAILTRRCRNWRHSRPETARAITQRWREKHRETSRANTAKWAAANYASVLAKNAKRAAALKQRLPKWADLARIRKFYEEAVRISRETGVVHHVDHVIPLRGKTISGLHVHTNLQVLEGSINCRKRNRFNQEECQC